jgi:alpha-tubulin suppressor-like RCC1 family protein
LIDVSSNFVVLHSPSRSAVFSTVWGGLSWTQISGISGSVSFVSASSDTGYAVVSTNQVWSWPLVKSGDLQSVQPAAATRIDGGVVSDAIVSFSVGPYGNIFIVDSQQRLYSFGNNVAHDGSAGLLCNQAVFGAVLSQPNLISSVPPVSEVQANGDVVYALSQNRTTLLACGRALYLGLGASPSNTTAFFPNWTALALPTTPSKTVRLLSVGSRHAHAVLSDGSIYSWGLNSANQSNLGSSSVILAPERLQDPNGSFNQRSVDSISSGQDYSVVASSSWRVLLSVLIRFTHSLCRAFNASPDHCRRSNCVGALYSRYLNLP